VTDHLEAVAAVFQSSSGAVMASLIRYCGDFDLAEDAVQEAFAVAVGRWGYDGIPPNPGGWIATTAKHRLIDRLRREQRRGQKEGLVDRIEAVPYEPESVDDDRLRLVFTCCHPALSLDVRVALTLRTVCGLDVKQIADAFVVSEATMAKRLVRGKRKIKVAAIPYEVPPPEDLDSRLSAVLAVVYLVFNAGYDAVAAGDASSVHLGDNAIGLGRQLDLLIPNEPEIMGLLALMLMHRARAATRFDAERKIVLLADQDRTQWDRGQISEAIRLVESAPRRGGVGQYWIQAAIAAEHVGPATASVTDWGRIVVLYDRLVTQTGGSEVVRLSRAIALAEAEGPAKGLAALEPLLGRLEGYVYFHSAAADMHRRAGNRSAAIASYRRAAELATSDAQRASLDAARKNIEGSS
jgi:RNA polymerase sigma-70 factor, ECF subfamily